MNEHANHLGDDGVHPSTCLCECDQCWTRPLGSLRMVCICPDCKNPEHHHLVRDLRLAQQSVDETSSHGIADAGGHSQ